MQKIKTAINRIQTESLDHLTDVSYLEYKLLPELGLNNRHMAQYPKDLHPYCGIGINSWQYPNQFSKYLNFLSKNNITSYLEIGCHKGGTFIITVEYLSRFNKINHALAVDNWSRDEMLNYATICENVDYVVTSSASETFEKLVKERVWDLILIDGDHSYQAVKKDFETVKNYARFIAFHDIKNIFCPGTQQIWLDIKNKYPNQINEWTDQYDEVLLRVRGSVMGIGLLAI